jgi:hypothetical protein
LAVTFVASVIDAFVDASREITPQVEDQSAAIAVAQAPSAIDVVEAPAAAQSAATFAWTGPNPNEVAPSGMLFGRVPGERWPYGPPSAHEGCCNLFPHRGSPGGLFCDCVASAADDIEYGVGA